MGPRRVLLTTFGSLGDLHPYLAVGRALRAQGHSVILGTQAIFRARVEAAGLEFRALRVATVEEPSAEIIRRVFAGGAGIRYLLRDVVMPSLRTAYEDTLVAAREADLLVTHPLTFATPLVAEKLGVPWLSTQLAPNGLHSMTDPPVLPGLDSALASGLLRAFPRLYRHVFRAIWRLGDWQTGRWLSPVAALRRELGLSRARNPLLAGAHSPWGVLALFSRVLVSPQRDWPARVIVTGFPFFRQEHAVPPALQTWLDDGPAPVVFTLGSSAVLEPGRFFTESVLAAQRLGRRALLIGHVEGGLLPLVRGGSVPVDVGEMSANRDFYSVPYADYAAIFPQAAAVVHQGGIGTTAEALRAGVPMLVVPFGVDQPDNASRVVRLGVAEVLSRRAYRANRVATVLGRLLSSAEVQAQAQRIGQAVRAEKGAEEAATAIGNVLNATQHRTKDSVG